MNHMSLSYLCGYCYSGQIDTGYDLGFIPPRGHSSLSVEVTCPDRGKTYRVRLNIESTDRSDI